MNTSMNVCMHYTEMRHNDSLLMFFQQHILVKSEFLRDYVAQVEINPDHKLIKVLPVNSNLTLTFLLGRSLSKSDKALLDSVCMYVYVFLCLYVCTLRYGAR